MLVLGRYDVDGRLRAVGRITPLEDAAAQLTDHLHPAGPEHLWTGVRFTATWGSREPLDPILVVPELVAEVSADTGRRSRGVETRSPGGRAATVKGIQRVARKECNLLLDERQARTAPAHRRTGGAR
ncbi:hypothetical protein [Streptomyces chryseus]|uniref:hypothetical protein n=1 Tax=Streptomyces chryseus TaxID=68186 RepID=UPI0019A02B3A|nr:hypothetical protein [Streptomyces chryseus]GGX44718.1 hypothetical protein GCM10010353_69470 [Streptomyces chryseus]